MCGPAVLVPLIGAAVGAGASIYEGSQAASAQKRAQQQAEQQARAQQQAQTEQYNKANGQSPDIGAMLSRNASANSAQSATFLTGPGGVAPSALNLGKSTLLGGGAS